MIAPAETPHHLKRYLDKHEIDALSDVERKERRIHLVNGRLARAERQLADTRQKRMSKMLRQWFRGEVLRDMHYGAPIENLRQWLRHEFVAAIRDAFSGRDQEGVIASVVRVEVGRALQGIANGGRTTPNTAKAYSDGMRDYIRKIVAEEVKRQVIENLSFEASISGYVHQPAKGQRSLQIMGKEDP